MVGEPFTILHVSDMQFGRHHQFPQEPNGPLNEFDNLLARLWDDIDLFRRAENLQPDLLICTGDLAEWAWPNEFAEAYRFLGALAERLALGRDRVITIPGNHDVHRKECLRYFEQCIESGEKIVPPWYPKWSAYKAAFAEFYKDFPAIRFTTDEPWSLFVYNDLEVVVAGLNSTWVEGHNWPTDGSLPDFPEHERPHHFGYCDERQLRSFAASLGATEFRGWLKIGAVHHNLERRSRDDDENLRDADDLERRLGQHLHLVLHGHTHRARFGRLRDAFPWFATGSAGLKQEIRPYGVPNQYQFLVLSRAGVRIRARFYMPDEKEWVDETRFNQESRTGIKDVKVDWPDVDRFPMIRVFVSYSWDSAEHKERILKFAQRLRSEGVDAWIDSFTATPEQGWIQWAAEEIERADYVLLALTENYVKHFTGGSVGFGSGWEGRIIMNELYEARGRSGKFIPIMFSESETDQTPPPLRGLMSFRVDTEEGYRALYSRITGRPQSVVPPIVGAHRLMPSGTPGNLVSALPWIVPVHDHTHADYYAGSQPLNEAKLILIGRGEVGKTCIVNRLVRDEFVDTSKTQGISITQWQIKVNGKEDVRLHVWDFGGQEIMHATHQFFLTQRSLYLLVLNGRQGGEDADAEYWLQLIESFAGESSVIIVLNKVTEHAFDLNRRGLQAKYRSVRDFVRVDCKDATGINDLRRVIQRETDALKDLRVPFPASWVSIKDRLSVMAERGENYISFDQYRDLCVGLREKDPNAQEALAGYLHSLGIALNYKDDPRLNDTHVLSPHWVTNGIYKILNWPDLEKRNGVLRLGDLAMVLPLQSYPKTKHIFLLDLMKKFDVCFEFPDDPQRRYLVPDLLGKEEPAATGEFDPTQCLNFQYHYNILPEGLLPRFIVRTHVLSEGRARWRTGVLLEFEGNRALVKADVQDRKTFISVTGPLEGRRRLLAVIRSDFERIHADIKKLQVMEMVPVPGRPDAVVAYAKLKALEQNGTKKFLEVFGSDVVELIVLKLLSGVDIEGSRRRGREPKRRTEAITVFISYSHKDETLRGELETHLKLLHRQGLISSWQDRKITAGREWEDQIDKNLEAARIILLLVSANFIASDYCYDKEMELALKRHSEGAARVVPVILRDADWSSAPFGKLQALPKDCRPVTLWPKKDSAWKDVALGVRKLVEEMSPLVLRRGEVEGN